MTNQPVGNLASRLLGLLVRLLPSNRRDWGRAMQAESASLKYPSERRRFALGCTRAVVVLTVKSPTLWRRLSVAVVAALVVGAEIALADVIGQTVPLALVLVLLFWLGRRPGMFGPVRAERTARAARASGYVVMVVYLLVLAVGYGASGIFRPEPEGCPARRASPDLVRRSVCGRHRAKFSSRCPWLGGRCHWRACRWCGDVCRLAVRARRLTARRRLTRARTMASASCVRCTGSRSTMDT